MIEIDEIRRLIDSLSCDWDRLSTDGRETLNELYRFLGMPTIKEDA